LGYQEIKNTERNTNLDGIEILPSTITSNRACADIGKTQDEEVLQFL